MNTDQINRIANRLYETFTQRRTYQPLRGDEQPDSVESAYAIQAAVYGLMARQGGAGELGGHKIALTSAALQQMCGIDTPVYGAIFKSQIFESPAQLPLKNYGHLGLEFEVAVQMGQSLPLSDQAWTRETIRPYVGAIMPAFELIEDLNADYSDLDAMSVLADRCWCAGTVLGAPIKDWQNLDLASCAVQLSWNGKVIDQGTTGESMGHPFNGLAWVANYLQQNGKTLQAGETIITGSALKTRFPEPGDQVTYQIESLGQVSAQLTE